MSKIHTISKQACIMKERIKTNAQRAQITCSLVLKFDWSKQVLLSES